MTTAETLADRLSSVELAQSFYKHHELAFKQVASAAKAEDRVFSYSAEQFDDWAVVVGQMPKRAREADDLVEQGGLTRLRGHLRRRLNQAARKSDGIERGFSVEAKNGRWRVALSERFLIERPAAIVSGCQATMAHASRMVEQAESFLVRQEYLDDEDRRRFQTDLRMAAWGIFNGLQTLEIIVSEFQGGTPVNLGHLQKAMNIVLRSGGKIAKPVRRVGNRRRAL